MLKKVRAFAPASVANVSIGFDILGFAIEGIGDEVVISLSDKPGVRLNNIFGNSNSLSLDINKNCVTVPIIKYLDHFNLSDKVGLEVDLIKNLPLGSGMGSSAASSVVGVFAANHLLGNLCSKIDLLQFILEGEKLASNTKHADNATPSLLGGFILIKSNDPLDVIQIEYPNNLICILAHPDMYVDTLTARKILPEKILLQDYVKQSGNLAGFIVGLIKNDMRLISSSLDDIIIEPIRKRLLPFYDDAKKVSLNSGAIGFGISGSGPSVFALADNESTANKISDSLKRVFEQFNLKNEIYYSKICKNGAVILEEE